MPRMISRRLRFSVYICITLDILIVRAPILVAGCASAILRNRYLRRESLQYIRTCVYCTKSVWKNRKWLKRWLGQRKSFCCNISDNIELLINDPMNAMRSVDAVLQKCVIFSCKENSLFYAISRQREAKQTNKRHMRATHAASSWLSSHFTNENRTERPSLPTRSLTLIN